MTDPCGDIESVERQVKAAGWQRIGIDGVNGAGKTFLAEALYEALEIPILDVNDYLFQNQGGYMEFIDFPALGAAMSSMPAFVLTGICLQEVLANLGMSLDGSIYIKRMRNGVWLDEDRCVFPDGVEASVEAYVRNRARLSEFFDEMPEHSPPVDDGDESPFVEEIMRYHDQHSPHEEADLVFERNEATV